MLTLIVCKLEAPTSVKLSLRKLCIPGICAVDQVLESVVAGYNLIDYLSVFDCSGLKSPWVIWPYRPQWIHASSQFDISMASYQGTEAPGGRNWRATKR